MNLLHLALPGMALLSAFPASEQEMLGSVRQEIAGGEVEQDYPAVGRIVLSNPVMDVGICTGTLIAPDVVLTAAHCIQKPSAMRFELTAPSDGETVLKAFGVRTALAHPKYTAAENGESVRDLGLLILEETVSAELAAPMAINRAPVENVLGELPVLSIGYGVTNRTVDDSGTKRSTQLSVWAVTEWTYDLQEFDRDNLVTTTSRGVCSGDSGGPDVIQVDGVDTIVGVHSTGMLACPGISTSGRVDVDATEFIDPVLQGHVPPGCTGERLEDAVCHQELESSGCTSTGSGPSALLLLLAPFFLGLLRRGSRQRV